MVGVVAGEEPLGFSHADWDVTQPPPRSLLGGPHPPSIVLHAAAWTDVDGAESDPEGAEAVNVLGTRNVVSMGAPVVAYSTDYVFDGDKREPYVETDETSPRTAYGRSKLAGEWTVAEVTPRHAIVRTAWLFGLHGKNFVDTMLSLGGPLKVVDDQVGCPTYTGHLAEALVELAGGRHAGVVHVAGGGECSWYEFAAEIFRQAEREVQLEPCTTAEFPRPAPRPHYSVLRSIRDQRGVAWQVWAVLPVAIEPNRIVDPITGVDRLPLPPEYAGGWIAFESARGERRRVGPLPDGWDTLDDDALLAVLDRAARVTPTATSGVAVSVEWRPELDPPGGA